MLCYYKLFIADTCFLLCKCKFQFGAKWFKEQERNFNHLPISTLLQDVNVIYFSII